MAPAASPFRIVQIPASNGAIGMSGCPGVGAEGLDADRAAVEAFQPRAIVSLMEAHEYGLMGCADLPAALSLLAPERYDLPFRRLGVPTARFERLWVHAGYRLRQILREGGRVLIHCHSGAGRTGLVAARLLVELGLGADEAITRVCAARPRAIETVAQSQHVRARRADVETQDAAGRILGCLLGGAVGDAFGYAVEFQSLAQIRERHGRDGLTEPRLQAGRLVVSDDTQMTLFTAEGLLGAIDEDLVLHHDRVIARVRRAYLEWLRTQREDWTSHAAGLGQYPELWAARAPGSTCLTALAAGARGTPETPINDSKGCGAVMRTAPLGLLRAIDADQAFRLADEAAALTHGHPVARLSAAALASLVRDLLSETPLDTALDRMESRLSDAADGADVLAAVRLARALAADEAPPARMLPALGQGWVGDEALAIAIYAVLKAGSFEDAVRLAVNHDGDSDSTGSIAGQIWGAWRGIESLPQAWIEPLDVLEAICDVAGRLIACAEAEDAEEVRRRLEILAPFARRAATSREACSQVMRDFHRAVQSSDWVTSFDWPAWQESAEFERLLTDPRAIQRASHVQLRRLVTAIVRRDRVGEGALEQFLRSGRISAMARRAEVLLVAVAA